MLDQPCGSDHPRRVQCETNHRDREGAKVAAQFKHSELGEDQARDLMRREESSLDAKSKVIGWIESFRFATEQERRKFSRLSHAALAAAAVLSR